MITSTWQPIATAPKDGTAVIIHVPNSTQPIQIAHWELDSTNGYWRTAVCVVFPESVDHWMPLPSTPNDQLVVNEHQPVAWMYKWNNQIHFTTTDQRPIEAAHPHFVKSVPLYCIHSIKNIDLD